MSSNEQSNPRKELENLIDQQGGNSLENCNLEFLGYQQGLSGEPPRKELAHLGAYKKGYISALNHLSQQESQEIENTHRQLLKKNKAAEKDIIQKLDRLIQEQGLDDGKNAQLELLGFQDGVVNKRAQEQFWSNYAYKKGYIMGTNRFWDKKFGSFPSEGEGL